MSEKLEEKSHLLMFLLVFFFGALGWFYANTKLGLWGLVYIFAFLLTGINMPLWIHMIIMQYIAHKAIYEHNRKAKLESWY